MTFALFLQILGAVSGISTILGHVLPGKVGNIFLAIGANAPALADALRGKQ